MPEIRDNMEAEDTYLEELENQERRALEAERIAKEAFKQIAEEKQRVEEAERKIHGSIQRMRNAGLSDTDICSFLNINLLELEQMTNSSNDK